MGYIIDRKSWHGCPCNAVFLSWMYPSSACLGTLVKGGARMHSYCRAPTPCHGRPSKQRDAEAGQPTVEIPVISA